LRIEVKADGLFTAADGGCSEGEKNRCSGGREKERGETAGFILGQEGKRGRLTDILFGRLKYGVDVWQKVGKKTCYVA